MRPGKKSTSTRASKSKQTDIELSLDDQNNTVEEEDEEAAAQQINQKIITNSMEEVKGMVVDSKENVTNVEAVFADHVNAESIEQNHVVEEEGERMKGLDKNDDANVEDDDAIERKTVNDK
ncbi:hypothetical protein LOK49_LG07G00429 [Camellia lanceoleosa]|uniref:Uncharacterized protein n=1 Tax=Camellia lanceoleosa TaxID=1840588 RepID=A0ACC0H5L8_9ERIC|nr:hypothetical protein LOK49_LG07G00429 [Camellia lanceoleosa]